MKGLFSFFIISCLVFCSSCKNVQTGLENGSKEEASALEEGNPEIIMILFFINDRDSVGIVETFSNYGIYKGSGEIAQKALEGDLKISFLDIDKGICQEKVVFNPLLKKVEYASDDGSGRIIAEAVVLEEATFLIRLQWKDCFHQIKVERFDDEEWKLLKMLNFTKPLNP
ncbi:hypothetical protein [Cecembia rubra]|uniref:hypothetical protein n=1 Tax=Cecembia rubra TaxID=1485585 RepID=UPI00271455B2|nr:hypothetical protein [Cecembia rubra]